MNSAFRGKIISKTRMHPINLMDEILPPMRSSETDNTSNPACPRWCCGGRRVLLAHHHELFPVAGLVSELPGATQKAAAPERVSSGGPDVQDASVAAGRRALLALRQPGPTAPAGPARIPGR